MPRSGSGARRCPYVSRGGLKLRGALDAFGIDRRGTDRPRRRGLHRRLHRLPPPARRGQGLRRRRRLRPARLEAPGGSAGRRSNGPTSAPTMGPASRRDRHRRDRRLLHLADARHPARSDAAQGGALIVALVKPQFEVGKGEVGNRGVVRDPALHRRVLAEIEAFCRELGLTVMGSCDSPLTGPAGNREFFLCFRKPPESRDPVEGKNGMGVKLAKTPGSAWG